jgi:phosphatidylglycerophosphate synthase
MESIKELREICEKEPHKEIWIHTFLNKKSLHLTKLLLHTPVTPNQVTVTGIIGGFIGVVLISSPKLWVHLLGYFLVFFYYMTDYSDGQIARYKKMTSITGRYLDYIGHIVVYPLMFLSLGVYLFNQSGNLINLLIGTTTALFILSSYIMNKLYILITGVKKGHLEKEREGKKVNFKRILLRIHKTINFQFYIIIFILIAEILQPFLTQRGIHLNLLFYVLIYVLLISAVTFFLQVIIDAKSLNSKKNKNK